MALKKNSWISLYENMGLIGEGGNAKVYRVKHLLSGEEFALKQLNRETKESKVLVQKIKYNVKLIKV